MSSLVAAASTTSGSGNVWIFAPVLLLIGWMVYSQRRRTKESLRVQSGLSVGDEVMTTSGLLGRITALDDEVATLEASPGVSIRFNRRAIAGPAPISPVPGSLTASASSESATSTAAADTPSTDTAPADTASDSTRLTD